MTKHNAYIQTLYRCPFCKKDNIDPMHNHTLAISLAKTFKYNACYDCNRNLPEFRKQQILRELDAEQSYLENRKSKQYENYITTISVTVLVITAVFIILLLFLVTS
jgi:DNA-directed RNA polymerase subunit RPC12/RpoP